MWKTIKPHLFLILMLIIIGGSMRFYRLATVPLSLHKDELVNVYTGRFILQNGLDLYGNTFPLLYFDKFGDFPPVIPMYVTAFGTYLFGVTDFGARFTVALITTFSVIPLYIIAFWVFKQKKTAFFTALLYTTIPWSIIFGRTSAEGSVALSVFLCGLLGVVWSIRAKKIAGLLIAAPLLFLTYLLYPGYRIMIPMVLFPLPFIFFLKKSRKLVIVSTILLLFSLLLTLGISRTTWGKGRFNQTSLFHIVSGVEIGNQQLIWNDKQQNVLLTKLIHNKPLAYSREFMSQYLSYFSGPFLFLKGGGEITHKVPNHGGLYLVMLALFVIPLFTWMKKRAGNSIDMPVWYYLVYLLLIAPIPGALTVIPLTNPHRALLMTALLPFIAGYGFYLLTKLPRFSTIAITVVYVVLALEIGYFMHHYINHIDYIQFIGNNEQAREAVSYINANKDSYNTIVIPKGDYVPAYYLYFSKIFDASLAGKFQKNYEIDSVGKVNFIPTNCTIDFIKKNLDKYPGRTLFMTKGECDTTSIAKLPVKKIANFITTFGNDAYTFYELKQD